MTKERTETEIQDPNSVDVDPQGYLVVKDKAVADLFRDKVKPKTPGAGPQARASNVSVGVVVSRSF
jgi:hypothetical protein